MFMCSTFRQQTSVRHPAHDHVDSSSHALERTADRHDYLLSMTSTLKPEAQRAFVGGRSAYSR